MIRRFLSMLLVVTLLMTGMILPMPGAFAMTAEEALFGNGTGAVAGESDVQTEAEAAIAGNTEGDIADETYVGAEEQDIDEYPTLQMGDRDGADAAAYIVMLQNRLIALGFLKDSADGVFGENTQVAVDQFQKLNGLERTGIADPDTQRMMFSDMSLLTTPSPENEVAFGSEAIRVQTKLALWGFLAGKVDGIMGKTTGSAITDFKNYVVQYQPTPSPVPTPSPMPEPTLAPGEMPVVIDMPITTPVPTPTPFVADETVDDLLLSYVDGDIQFDIFTQSVQNGDRNDEVRRVQTRLKQLHYLYAEADGKFGNNTQRALMYFQRKHDLAETGIADERTQRVLFSESAQESEEYVNPYKLYVDVSDQRVYAFGWDGESYSIQSKAMVCSTGEDETPTPLGTYQAYGQTGSEWYWFEGYKCYARWAYGIVGGILFHSVTYDKDKNVHEGAVRKLGRKASHGCIRLSVEDAKWIYDNCPYGTTVIIQE